MKFVKISNGNVSDSSILSVVANTITKIDGISNRHGEFIEEFISTVSGHDLNKGIKIDLDDDQINEIDVYIDLDKNYDVEKVITNVIDRIKEELKIFLTVDVRTINVHVLEVK